MRLYYGGYGHHPRGKLYAYWGNNNYRTGQQVVAPVTNKRSGKTYNTMFTIMRTSAGDGEYSETRAQTLSQKGIGVKFIQGTDVLANLPGGAEFKSKAEWSRDSNQRYRDALAERLGVGQKNADNTAQRNRILGDQEK